MLATFASDSSSAGSIVTTLVSTVRQVAAAKHCGNTAPLFRMIAPPLSSCHQIDTVIRKIGYAVLDPASVCELIGCEPDDLNIWRPYWDRLPIDHYLLDGGRYRRRRHSCFVVDRGEIQVVQHRAHWQPLKYNSLHGGVHRWFEPLDKVLVGAPAWGKLLKALAQIASELRSVDRWFVEAHQFRVDTTGGSGRPTPEGAHRDGVDMVAVLLVYREQIEGGETRIFDGSGMIGQRFTLHQPWSLLLLDDERLIHESTAICPTGDFGYRDTLVVTFRAGGFMET